MDINSLISALTVTDYSDRKRLQKIESEYLPRAVRVLDQIQSIDSALKTASLGIQVELSVKTRLQVAIGSARLALTAHNYFSRGVSECVNSGTAFH